MKRIIKKLNESRKHLFSKEKHLPFEYIHQVSSDYLKEFYSSYDPVFILNTGRSGSAFMKKVFDQYDQIDAHHEAFPNLFLLSDFAFSNQKNNLVLKKVFEAARVELMLTASIQNKIYLESNQCLVFYVKQIKDLFPKAKFVHLTRHPGDFVRSAIMKGWHKNDSVWELGRIKNENKELWNQYSQIEKLSWVWLETHKFIEDFKRTNLESFTTIRLEDLVSDNTQFKELLSFIGVNNHLSDIQIKELLDTRVNKLTVSKDEPSNMFKLKQYPKYDSWSLNEKMELREIVKELSLKYNYEL